MKKPAQFFRNTDSFLQRIEEALVEKKMLRRSRRTVEEGACPGKARDQTAENYAAERSHVNVAIPAVDSDHASLKFRPGHGSILSVESVAFGYEAASEHTG